MFRICILCAAVAVLSAVPLSAFEVSFAFDTGLITGTTCEYVYEGDKCISRLDWQDRAVPMLSFSGRAVLSGTFLQLGITSAVPVQSGVMEDYDFLVAGSDEPSLYSKHNAYLDKYFDSSVALGYDLRISAWRLTPSAGFAYRNRKWTAQDGFLQYPESDLWTGEEPKDAVYGPVISYEQAVLFLFASLEAGYVVKERFLFSVAGSLYPAMRGDTIDNHLLRDMQFYDTMREGFGYSMNIGLRYNFGGKKRVALTVRAGYEKMDLKGNTAMRETGISDGKLTVTEGYGSRMENGQWTVALGFTCRFDAE
ncbi:MAG: omptin family outer membrane protease [Spirochaetaceae bacterium]|nr:omptin family outer membrane protease [Spirochaetaceae bacterium]